jgi:hypothetical protein
MALSQTLTTSGAVLSLAIGTTGLAAENAVTSKTLKVFVSGHSLTDRPFPDYLTEIAAAAGITLQWDMQSLPGSSILQRLQEGQKPLLKSQRDEVHRLESLSDEALLSTVNTDAYDYMVITEQHRVLDSLIWQNSFQSLRNYHDRFIAKNPIGKTYFFTPWISLSDRANPHDWIAYEREALPVWQCMVSQINQDLVAEGRSDRIQFIPTSWALARLVEHIAVDADVAGFEGLDTPTKIDAIFSDEVHLSPLGMYYVAAVTYAAIHSDGLPTMSLQSLHTDHAKAVRDFATRFMKEYRATPTPSHEDCASGVSLAFASHYAAYTERTYHRQEEGILAARVKRLRDTLRFAWRFRDGLR